MVATDKGHVETVKLLLEAKASVNYTEEVSHQTVLIHNGKVALSQSSGWSALFFAAKKGHLAIVKLLLEYEADMSLKAKVHKA